MDSFSHLEGASEYNFDDLASLHSGTTSLSRSTTASQDRSALTKQNLEKSAAVSSQNRIDGLSGADAEAIAKISNLDLNLDDLGPGAQDGAGPSAGASGVNGKVAGNGDVGMTGLVLDEQDFDGVLDDLNRDLPPHACRFVLSVATDPLPSRSSTIHPPFRQLLRYPQPSLRGKVPSMQQVVLQFPW